MRVTGLSTFTYPSSTVCYVWLSSNCHCL